MRTFKIAASIFAASATLAVAADVDTVLTALSTINTDLKTLNTDVNKVSGGITSIDDALQASVDTITVDNDIIAATAAVNNAAKFSASDSKRLISAIDTLTASSNQTITTTIKKASAFGGLAPVVLAALYAFQGDSQSLGVAFASKLDSSALNQGVADLTALNNQFVAAINVYKQASQPT